MSENPYIEKVAALLAGDLKEIVVEKEDFFLFREVWINHPEKNEIIGEASLGGRVVYRKAV